MKTKTLKKIFLLTLGFAVSLMILTACSGSKNYQGTWTAKNSDNEDVLITFRDREFTIEFEGETQEYSYVQNQIGTSNGTRYYGIEVDDTQYTIFFSDKKTTRIALILEPSDEDEPISGKVVFVMGRPNYPISDYYEITEKYLE